MQRFELRKQMLVMLQTYARSTNQYLCLILSETIFNFFYIKKSARFAGTFSSRASRAARKFDCA